MSALALCTAGAAVANDELQSLIDDPAQWAIQTGDYENQRYSEPDAINTENLGDLQVKWMFSTGVLRGHEGSPLVIADTMHVHTRSRTSSTRST